MHTLKVQLGLTLTIVLSLAMLLFGIVLLMLWQRESLQRETVNSMQFLELSAMTLGNTPPDKPLPATLKSYLKRNDIACIGWKSNNSQAIQYHGTCPKNLDLTPYLQLSSKGSVEKKYEGMVWNGLFFSRQYLVLTIPVTTEQSSLSATGLIRSLDKVSQQFTTIRPIFFSYLIINLIIFGVIGFTRLVHLVIRPIQQLAKLADSRTEYNDTAFFTTVQWGELAQLSLSLNQLIARIDGDKQQLKSTVLSLKKANQELENNKDEMIRTEKLASIGRLSAGLAHEIGNPLGIIQGYVELLADNALGQEEREIFCKKITEELDRINGLIRNLLDLSRSHSGSSAQTVDIHTVLEDIIEAVTIRKSAIQIEYPKEFKATKSKVHIDIDGIRQVILNSILNGIDAIEEKSGAEQGKIVVETANDLDDTISINIRDNGIGLAEDHIDSIFDPFFTTKEVGKGTGLGLAVAHNMIKSAGGTLQFSSTVGAGSTLCIRLPLA